MRAFARGGIILYGAFALIWAVLALPTLLAQQKPVSVASALERGERYSLSALLAVVSEKSRQPPFGICNATAERASMMILTRILEDPAVAENHTLHETAQNKLEVATRALLRCSPSDSLGWLILFGLAINANGYSPECGAYLQLSYDASPNEAAVAFWRNRLVLELFDRLPARFTDLAVPEFVKLVDTERLYPDMGDIFEHAAPALQKRLADEMKTAQKRPREVFARMLQDRGVRAVIPDVASRPERPWN
jgi:hypothetical protein